MVEIAFGRFKARWRRFIKQNHMLVENVPNIVAACCVLHNICEIHGDTFNDEWMQALDGDSVPSEQETLIINNTRDGHDIREALVEYFCNNPL